MATGIMSSGQYSINDSRKIIEAGFFTKIIFLKAGKNILKIVSQKLVLAKIN